MIRTALALAALLLCACGPTRGNCTATNCAGCCDDQSFCQVNFTASACGRAGERCLVCPAGNTCAEGVCALYAAGGGSGGGGGTGGGTGGGSGGGSGGGAGGGSPDSGKIDSGVVDAGFTRFLTTAASWSVPPTGLADGFNSPKSALSIRVWDTLDMDGDGRVDLVHTANPATGTVWTNAASGAPFWKVYRNLGNGFAPVPTVWAVPAAGVLADGFFATSSAAKTKQWATFDIDGDGRPDLVQTANTTDQVFPGPVWRVYKNNGTGFSTVAITWPVPTANALTFPDGYNAKDSPANPKAWSTFDLDGDDLPDFVLTSNAGVVFAGPQWRMHKNLGTGFAAAITAWSVPDSGLADGFTMPNSAVSQRQWATIDMDGDGRPDLVQTANTMTNAVFSSGASVFWRVYKNSGAGFTGAFTQWPVPANGQVDGFYTTEISATTRRWSTRDLNGDGLPDLVHTTNLANSQVFGTDAGVFWNVYRGNGSGFAAAPSQWTVPLSGLPEGFFFPVSNASLNRWMTIDLDGDGAQDLVHTANTANDQVWDAGIQPIWKLYRGGL